MHGRGQKGVTAAERRPVQALEQPLFAAKDQILGFDLNDVPTRVAADHLGANDADAAAPAILAQRDPGALGKEIGRAHVCTPVTNAHLVCRLLLEKKKPDKNKTQLHTKIYITYNIQSYHTQHRTRTNTTQQHT